MTTNENTFSESTFCGRGPIRVYLVWELSSCICLFVCFAEFSNLFAFLLQNNDRLHVACGVGASTFVVQSLLDCYPEATLMKTTKGSSPLQCLNLTASRNKKEVTHLLKRYYRKVDEKYKPAQRVDSERMLV